MGERIEERLKLFNDELPNFDEGKYFCGSRYIRVEQNIT